MQRIWVGQDTGTTPLPWPIARGDSVSKSAIIVTCILKYAPTVAFDHARSRSFVRSPLLYQIRS